MTCRMRGKWKGDVGWTPWYVEAADESPSDTFAEADLWSGKWLERPQNFPSASSPHSTLKGRLIIDRYIR